MINKVPVPANESVRHKGSASDQNTSPYLEYAGEYLLTPEIGYYAMDVPAGEGLRTEFATSNSPLGFIFCLEGSAFFSVSKNGMKHEYTLKQGEYSIAYMPNVDGVSIIDGRQRYMAVNMFVVPLRFRSLVSSRPAAENSLDSITGIPKDSIFLHKGSITKEISLILHDFINKKTSDLPCRINEISKLYEAVTLSLEQLDTRIHNRQKSVLQPADVELLLNAGRILTENLASPPSLLYLSKASGLNSFKLKNGFKEVFGTTVYGFLTEKRMEKAREMLDSGKYSVSDAAWDLGYTNVSHFIELFRRHYGITPGKFLSERRSLFRSELVSKARHG